MSGARLVVFSVGVKAFASTYPKSDERPVPTLLAVEIPSRTTVFRDARGMGLTIQTPGRAVAQEP